MASFSSGLQLIARYSAIMLASKAMVLGTNFVLALHMSNADFGYVALAQAVFLAAISVLGLTSQAAYVRFSDAFGAGAVLRALFPAYAALGGLAVAIGLVVYLLVSQHDQYRWFALLPAAGLLASHLASMSAVARTTNNLRAYSLAEAGRPAILLVLVVLFIALQPNISGVAFFAMALTAATGLSLVGSVVCLRGAAATRSALSTSRVLRYLLPLVVVQLVALFNNVGDRFILSAWVPISDVGLYSKAYLVGSTLGMLFDSVSVLWGPYVVKHRDRYASDIHPLLNRTLSIVAVCSIAVMSFSVWLWGLGDVSVAGVSAELLLVGVVVTSAFIARIGYQVCVPVLCAFDQTRLVARLSLVSALIGLGLNILLIPWVGLYGAAIATWVSFAVYSVAAYHAVTRTTRADG